MGNDIVYCFDSYTAKIKKLESQHWDECRQIAHYQQESRVFKEPLYRALDIMKLVLEESSSFKKCQSCIYEGNYTKECIGCYGDKWKWRYHDECEKLVKDLTDINVGEN